MSQWQLQSRWITRLTGPLLAGVGLSVAEVEAGEEAMLRGTIRDAATGQLAPSTVTITDANGKVVIERESFQGGFRCNGAFARRLPPGRTRIRVARGFETRMIEQELELRAGTEVQVEFVLERQVDLRRRGWYSGDSHAHMIHGENTIPVDFDFVALTAQAQDLQYLSLAQAWRIEDPTPEALQAQLGARSTADCVLAWNLEAPKNYYRGDAGRCLGHCWNLALRGRTREGLDVIRVLREASAWDYESAKPSFANFESHHLIHAQGGAVFYTHPARWWMGPWGGQGGYPKRERMRVSNLAVELPLDVLLGPTFDGLDVITGTGELAANAQAFELWALLLNHGYRLAATASSDACFDRPGGAVPGSARTYTYLENGFSLSAVARATAAGQTFATTGPLLLATVAGRPPGASFPAGSQPRTLEIQAWPSGSDTAGLHRVEVLRNGTWYREIVCDSAPAFCHTNLTLQETNDAWYCVRALGSDPQRQRAISGAFFFEKQPHRPPAPARARVRARLVDARTGQRLTGTLTEVTYSGAIPRAGMKHRLKDGEGSWSVPGTVRLCAEATGYRPLTLSPFFDYPALVDTITKLEDKDLLDWKTFERIKALLGDVPLTFRLEPKRP